MAKKNKASAALAETEVAKGRAATIAQYEIERLELKAQMEKVMGDYAKATGLSKLAKRKFKVGKAPNDYKA